MITVYNRSTGQPVQVAHPIDAKDYVAGGGYSWYDPNPKPEMNVKRMAAAPAPVEISIPAEEKADVVEPEVKVDKPVIPKRIIRK